MSPVSAAPVNECPLPATRTSRAAATAAATSARLPGRSSRAGAQWWLRAQLVHIVAARLPPGHSARVVVCAPEINAMDTSQCSRGSIDVAVLATVRDGYGYDVIRRLRAAGLDEGIGDASVYGTLRRLYAAGALTSYVVPSDEGPHRKYYGITEHGAAMLAEWASTWDRFAGAIGGAARAATRRWPRERDPDARAERRRYLEQVRAALADLPEAERDALLADVESHVAEVSEETGDELVARLGSPDGFAAELRAAAGLPPRTPQPAATPPRASLDRSPSTHAASASGSGRCARRPTWRRPGGCSVATSPPSR